MEPIYVVTGAAGHLGSTVVQTLLSEGRQVRGLLLPSETPVVPGIKYVRGNIRNLKTLAPLFQRENGQELRVIHTAGLVDITGKPAAELHSVNVDGTKNLLAMSQKFQVDKFVYVSSVHAIPEPSGGGLVTEISRFNSELVTGGYAKTKAEATQAVLDAAAMGLPAVVVQPSGILGPGDLGRNHLVQMILDFMEGRLHACVPGGYDIVDVRDVAEGCIQAAERGQNGQCYILSGAYAEIQELLSITALLCGKTSPPLLPMRLARIAEPFLRFGAELLDRRPLYTRYALDTVSSGIRFSNQKARNELGYTVRRTQATVRDTVSWLLEHKRIGE